MLGLTLAEIMMILLFALLLLLGAMREERDAVAEKNVWGDVVDRILIAQGAQERTPEMEEALDKLLAETMNRQREDESISDTWTRISEEITGPVPENAQTLQDQLEEQESELEALEEALVEAQEAASSAESYSEALFEQLEQEKAGETPPCLYEPAAPNSGRLRGISVPLGLVRIEDNQLTFETVYRDWLSGPLVDFFGRPVNSSVVLALVSNIPTQQSLSVEGFGAISLPIRRDGEVDTDAHRKCIYTMNYIMQDGVPLHMFTDMFQEYYLPQERFFDE
jgi:hypothetical protein